MCGFVVDLNSTSMEGRQSALDSLSHRGPDSAGEWISDTGMVWMGHRRLAIVGLDDLAKQPLCNENRSIWLVCNGEIYNYPSLRRRLEGLGHTFISDSDNEVLIHAYEAWGEGFVEYVEGMFAFVIWDDEGSKLLAARDRVGIKPLYFLRSGSRLILASEADAMLPLNQAIMKPNPKALAYVMTLGYVPSPFSIWEGVQKLDPGMMMIWKNDHSIKFRRYWSPPEKLEYLTRKNEEAIWCDLFNQVTEQHLMSDVPVGLFLSGGIDSTCVATSLHEQGKSLEAITVHFPGSNRDEAAIAAQITSQFEFPHWKIPVEISDIKSLMRQVASDFDEPQSYSALLTMYAVSRAAAEKYKVVLSGDGGDEVFAGYNWYRKLKKQNRRIVPDLRWAFRSLVKRFNHPSLTRKAARHFGRMSLLHRHAWNLHPRFLPEETELLMEPLGLEFSDEDMIAPLKKYFIKELPMRRALQRVDLMTFCSDSILAKVDRASMAHSLEVRVPFLDHRIIEWGYSRPEEPEESTINKPLLRRYLRDRVPSTVLDHPKQGFSFRLDDNFDWDWAVDVVKNGYWIREGLWSKDWMRFLEPGVPYRNARVWILAMLSLWAESRLSKQAS